MPTAPMDNKYGFQKHGSFGKSRIKMNNTQKETIFDGQKNVA